jgi:hypothetical protein
MQPQGDIDATFRFAGAQWDMAIGCGKSLVVDMPMPVKGRRFQRLTASGGAILRPNKVNR